MFPAETILIINTTNFNHPTTIVKIDHFLATRKSSVENIHGKLYE